MDKTLMMNQWDKMAYGLNQMANLLAGEGVFDEQRLPTNAVLWVIAALYSAIPEAGDRRGLVRTAPGANTCGGRFSRTAMRVQLLPMLTQIMWRWRAVLLGEKGEEAVPIF